MLKLADLAQRLDFRLGPLSISPSRRHIEGPAGKAHVEPLVMQAFLLLLHARGKVVTRSELFEECWGGAAVGDDSLNRAVAGVRRIAAETAPELFEIETIPRTGYRLVGEILSYRHYPVSSGVTGPESTAGLSRRALVVAGIAATAALGGAALWMAPPRSNRRFNVLMAEGEEALRSGDYGNPAVVRLYEQAVELKPRSATAWGALAFFRSEQIQDAPVGASGRSVQQAEEAAKQALEIDPNEPTALTARYKLHGPMLDWATRDEHLRSILAIDGGNIPALRELMALVQAAGLTRESRNLNERVLALAPLSRPHLVNRAQKLWILGKVPDADKVIDHVRGLWPDYPFGFAVRMMILAFTGRPAAARSLLDNHPQLVRQATAVMWRTSLDALEWRTPSTIEAARTQCVDSAKEEPRAANLAAMISGALGLTDTAFQITNGFLLGRGKAVSSNPSDSTVNNFNRRMTPWLFTPPLAAMRADPRFLKLCEELGLVDYWRARGVRPDYRRG